MAHYGIVHVGDEHAGSQYVKNLSLAIGMLSAPPADTWTTDATHAAAFDSYERAAAWLRDHQVKLSAETVYIVPIAKAEGQ